MHTCPGLRGQLGFKARGLNNLGPKQFHLRHLCDLELNNHLLSFTVKASNTKACSSGSCFSDMNKVFKTVAGR